MRKIYTPFVDLTFPFILLRITSRNSIMSDNENEFFHNIC